MSHEPGLTAGDRALALVRAHPRDDAAWREFYVCFRPQVAALLYRLGARGDVPDLTQDVFLRFLRSSPWRHDWTSLPDRQVVLSYLRKIARTAVVSKLRSAARRPEEEPTVHLDDLHAAADAAAIDSAALLERLAADLGEQDARLLRRVARGASIAEIAADDEISYSAAGVRIHRLKEKVRALLSGYQLR